MSTAPQKTPFPTFEELSNAHLELCDEVEQDGSVEASDEQQLSRIRELLDRIIATGVILENASERRSAQSLLDYWTTLLRERTGSARLYATLVRFDPEQAPDLPDSLCPYVGLDSFGEQTANFFFGRAEFVQQLISELAQHRLVIVVGPSGSGKSSVVRAGLLPRLRKEGLSGQRVEQIIELVPGVKPRFPNLLDGAAQTLVFVDQFEEIFTLCESPADRLEFITALESALSKDSVRIVMTMRSDFESYLAKYDSLYQQARRLPVPPLSANALRAAIDKPAAAVGLIYGPGVIDALLNELLGEPAGLPLLQFTLLRLWKDKRRNRVTMDVFKKVGGGRQALARHADEVFASLPNEKQETCKRILLRLGRPLEGYGVEVMRSRIRLKELFATREDPQRIIEVVQRLVAEGLLRKTASAGEPLEEHQIEIGHEALVRNWPKLVEWLNAEKLEVEKRRRWESLLGEWRRLGKGRNGLLEEVQLRELVHWLDSPVAEAVGYDVELLQLRDASALHIKAEKSKRERRIRVVIGVLVALLCANFAFSFLAMSERGKANRAAHEADVAAHEARKQTALAEKRELDLYIERGRELLLSDNPLRAVLWLQEAYQRDRHNSTVRYLLAWALRPIDAMRQVLTGHEKRVRYAAFSPNGRRVVTVGDDRAGRVFDVDSGKLVFMFRGHNDIVLGVSYSPDGHRIATASWDGTVRLWDAKDGTYLKELRGHKGTVWSAQWSPNGRRIVSASVDRTARVFDVESGRQLLELKGSTGWVTSAAYSPDSRSIVTANADGTAMVFDATTGRLQLKLDHPGRSLWVVSAAYSPDGLFIVTASEDRIARIWDAQTGQKVRELTGHTAALTGAAYSPDGKRIVTASQDRTARIWEAGEGRLLAVLIGHSDTLYSVAYSPDGARIVTASEDHTARIWEADSSRLLAQLKGMQAAYSPDGEHIVTASSVDKVARIYNAETGWLLRELTGHTSDVGQAAYSFDGKRIVTASADRTARVFDADHGKPLLTLSGHTQQVRSAAFSPDGKRIATASYDQTARIWDAESGKSLAELKGHEKELNSIAFSPDGRFVVTASKDHTARIFEVESGRLVRTISGHDNVVWSAAYSPDGQRIVTASADQTARIWDAVTGQLLRELKGHADSVTSAQYSRDGARIVTASLDQTARVFEAENGRLLFELRGFLAQVSSAAYSPDGRRIVTATATSDEGSQIWDASPEERSPEEIARLLRCRVPYRLENANIVVRDVDVSACSEPLASKKPQFARSTAAYWAGVYAFRRGDKESALARFAEDRQLTQRSLDPMSAQGSLLVQILTNGTALDSPESQELFKHAMALQKQQDRRLSDAEAEWKTLINLMRQAQKNLYQYEGALAVAQMLISRREKDPVGLRGRQSALFALGRFDEVLEGASAVLSAERVGDARSRCMDAARGFSAARMRNNVTEQLRWRTQLVAEYNNLAEHALAVDDTNDLRHGLQQLSPSPPHLNEVLELLRFLERRKSDESEEELDNLLSSRPQPAK